MRKKIAFQSVQDCNVVKKRLNKEISDVKRSYNEKVETQFQPGRIADAWEGLTQLTFLLTSLCASAPFVVFFAGFVVVAVVVVVVFKDFFFGHTDPESLWCPMVDCSVSVVTALKLVTSAPAPSSSVSNAVNSLPTVARKDSCMDGSFSPVQVELQATVHVHLYLLQPDAEFQYH